MRLLISAGGTGGGVYPALAVAGALDKSTEMLWVGSSGGMEEGLVQRAGLPFKGIPAAGLHGVGLRALPGNLLQLARGVLAARQLIHGFDPDVLFFTGGYVGGPVALAGWRRPMLTYVPDIEPALSQRLIGRLADRICVTTETSLSYYRRRAKVKVTGYPTRFSATEIDREDARREFGLAEDLPVAVALGGSRGARSLNEVLWRGLDRLLEDGQLVHITGERDWPRVENKVQQIPEERRDRYRPYPYLHERMGAALAAADLVVSRAGASVLGDYPLFALPAVLVPYPHAWRYQRTNARYMERLGAAIVVEDDEVDDKLIETIRGLLGSKDRRRVMGTAAAEAARPKAAGRIAAELRALAGEGDLP